MPETLVEIYGNELLNSNLSNLEKEKLRINQIVNMAIKAQENHYDVFAVGCTLDPGRSKIRELLDIPSAFIGESSLNFACTLGKNIGIVARTKEISPKFKKNIQDYGLKNMIIKMSHLSFTLEQLALSFNNPESIIKEFLSQANKLVRRGVEVIIPGCGILNMLLQAGQNQKIKGIPILDSVAVLIKTAELFGSMVKR